VRQLNDEPKLVYKVGYIRKERVQLGNCSRARKPVVARCTGESWGFYGRFNSGLGGFLIGLAFQGLSSVNWFG
jgi:hypothetical protein